MLFHWPLTCLCSCFSPNDYCFYVVEKVCLLAGSFLECLRYLSHSPFPFLSCRCLPLISACFAVSITPLLVFKVQNCPSHRFNYFFPPQKNLSQANTVAPLQRCYRCRSGSTRDEKNNNLPETRAFFRHSVHVCLIVVYACVYA